MKTTKLLLAAALFTGFATLGFAGPGPQFWTQQAKNQQEQQAKAALKASADAAKAVKVCATCTLRGATNP